MNNLVMVEYWSQFTIESGGWKITGPISENTAQFGIDHGIFDQGRIIRPGLGQSYDYGDVRS